MPFAELVRRRDRRREEVRERALASARRAAVSLRGRFCFRDLFLFGSILGRGFRLTSDVDFVVSGMDMRDFHRAHAFLMGEMGGPLEIDLKALEDLPEQIQKQVREEGVRIA
jgi:predicted nucleotidyltransferase